MSERGGGGGFGAFLFGIVLGAVAGFVFAPTEGGENTRRKVTKGLRNLKELAEDKVDEVRGLLKEAEEEAESEESEESEDPEEALISGIAATQSPTFRSLALADTCWVNLVFAVQVTATWPP